jgi:N-methylhydantoinase B
MVRLAISKMLLASGEFADHAMSGWPGAKAQEELQGINQFGREFGADILDGMAGGGGARIYQDGVDTGGLAGSPKISISNVEQYELEYPILYLYRRQLADSGGAGMYRGGNGIDRMYVVHRSESIPDVVMHCIGARLPATSGLSGGLPSATNQFYVKRQSSVESTLAAGTLPVDFDTMDGAEERYGPMSHTSLSRSDIYRSISNGGGGYGDPLDRDPVRVAQDVRTGRVTIETARSLYGVIIGDDDAFDADRTARERETILSMRATSAQAPRQTMPQPDSTDEVARINSGLLVVRDASGSHYYACSCSRVISPLEKDIDDYVAVQTLEPQQAGAHIRPMPSTHETFALHARLCPSCNRQLSVDLVRSGDPPLPPDRLVPGMAPHTAAMEVMV